MIKNIDLKKINTIIALIIVFTLLGHIVTTMIFLLNGFRIELLNNIFARTTYALFLLHILISIYVLFKHDAKPITVKYPKESKRVWIQRASGVVMIILLHAHISQMVMVLKQIPIEDAGKIKFCVINIMFFAAIFVHIAVSFSRAFISLGIMTEIETIEKTDRLVRILSLLAFIAMTVALISFIAGY